MGMVVVTQTGIEAEAILSERTQSLWVIEPVLNDKARHAAPAAFGIHRHDLELRTLVDIKIRLHDSHLFLYTLPIKEMLKLFGG